ncbi:hypothetical protein BH11BAC2_BH11BAC2_14730 [soil metagenome]
MKHFLFLVSIFSWISIVSFTQESNEVKIVWSESVRLKSSDFKARTPQHALEKKLKKGHRRSSLEGYIFSGIGFIAEQKGHNITYHIQAFMVPNQSWLRDANSATTLEHEQAHFDITEIYSRLIKKELQHTKSVKQGSKVYHRLFKSLQDQQNAFDADHLGEDGVNEKWKVRINKDLNRLVQYSNASVVVKI